MRTCCCFVPHTVHGTAPQSAGQSGEPRGYGQVVATHASRCQRGRPSKRTARWAPSGGALLLLWRDLQEPAMTLPLGSNANAWPCTADVTMLQSHSSLGCCSSKTLLAPAYVRVFASGGGPPHMPYACMLACWPPLRPPPLFLHTHNPPLTCTSAPHKSVPNVVLSAKPACSCRVTRTQGAAGQRQSRAGMAAWRHGHARCAIARGSYVGSISRHQRQHATGGAT